VQTTQALAVLAQVSVAFAGFSAIVTAFGKRNALGFFSQSAAVYLADAGGCFFVCTERFARLLLSGSPSHLLSSPSEPDEADAVPGGPARP
jgi:hypothetical protein